MTRTVFYGFGAFIGSIRGATRCEWWAEDPTSLQWATAALITTDLGKNVSAARAGTIPIADIEVDDHRIDGGLTTAGPLFPAGATIGAIWLSEGYWQSLGGVKPQRLAGTLANDYHDYELTSVQCWDGELDDRRFYGFHAHIKATAPPNLTLVEIWNPGTAKTSPKPAGEWWLDLDKAAHPIAPGLTAIAAGGAQTGALFLDEATTKSLALLRPKLPVWLGEDSFANPQSEDAQRTPSA